MKVLVDGVFFQLARTGIARVWSEVLPRLALNSDVEIVLLDRGSAPRFDRIQTVEFPSYSMASNSAADSFLVEKFCRELGVDVFTSTYYTTPVTIPSALMVYDMIPEVLEFGETERIWMEKQIAVSFASRYVCISKTTLSDLVNFHPPAKSRAIVAHCGLNREVFKPRDEIEVEEFKRAFRVTRPYYLLVGSREQYKNGKLVFDAVKEIAGLEIELLCIGGESQIDSRTLAQLPNNISVRRLQLADGQLACAYAGAEALIVPSMYEGFGLPVIEAMSCGCPVITTRRGALGEISGSAVIFISGYSPGELREAMQRVTNMEYRAKMIRAGLSHAARYDDWSSLAHALLVQLRKSVEDGGTTKMKEFFQSWKKLRAIQADVDTYFPEQCPEIPA